MAAVYRSACLVAILVVASAPLVAQEVITGGEVRALIDGELAVPADVYEAYQKCLAAIPLAQPLSKVLAERTKCKEQIRPRAFMPVPSPGKADPRTVAPPMISGSTKASRAAWQSMPLRSAIDSGPRPR